MRTLAVVAALLLVAGGCSGGSGGAAAPSTTQRPAETTTTPPPPPLVPPTSADGSIDLVRTQAPDGFAVPGAQWIELRRADGHTQLAAIFVPAGPGPFPTVVYLHGSSGLASIQVQWARQLADAGYLVLVGCYLAGDPSKDPKVYLPCGGLATRDAADEEAITTGFTALIDTATALGLADPSLMGLVGISFGAGVALDSFVPSVQAVVGDAGYGSPDKAGPAPILLLGGTADPQVEHSGLVDYEDALRAAGKDVESHYYDGAGHVVTLQPDTTVDATKRVIAFLDQHLK